MAARGHLFAVAVILVLLHLTGYSNAESILKILPQGEVQSWAIGSEGVFTCVPEVDDPRLITQMEWVDSRNRRIDSAKILQANQETTMYTEKRPGNSLSLMFKNLQEEQGGKYTCRAYYANNEKLERSVTIETIVAITWEDAPINQYPILGEDYNVKCKVRSRPSPAVDWLHNGELIDGTNDHYVIETHSLKLKKVTTRDDGTYTCRASVPSTGELKERSILVEVHIKPEIQEPNSSSTINVVEGETADIICRATGKPPPKFKWVKTIHKEDLSKADRFAVNEDTGVMSIRNIIRKEDDGEYQCIAQNAAGSTNMNIRLNVIVKPKIMELINKTEAVGKEVQISCKAFGHPPPEVYLRKHTSEKRFELGGQPDDDRISLQNQKDGRSGETIGTLTIRNVIRSDDGLYECIGKNEGGTSFKSGHLTVEFPPTFEATDNRTVFAWENHPGNMTCIASSIPNATIEWFLGNYRLESNQDLQIVGNGPISFLIVEPRDNRFYGTFKCKASNKYGQAEHKFYLKEGKKPEVLSAAKVKEMTATTALFDFGLPGYDPELPIKTITIQYKTDGQTWNHALNRTWTANSTYIIENLRPSTNYEFRFAAGNDVGLGNWAHQFTERTLDKSRPGVPKIRAQMAPGVEYEVSPFSNQYEVSWLMPVDNGEVITHFQIKYCQMRRVAGEWEELAETCRDEEERGTRTAYWLKPLYSDSYYKVEVRARNVFGWSEPGIIKIKTNRGNDFPGVVHHQGALISSGAIIGIVVAVLIVIIIVVDVICCCAQKTGIIFYVCERSRRKPMDEEDTKLGRDEKEPLREEKTITPIIDSGLRRETSITFDGKRSISKTGFVGKDSAV